MKLRTLTLTAALSACAPLVPVYAQTYVGASGYILMGHTGGHCAWIYLAPNIGSAEGGAYFSIDTSSASPLTPQAVSAQVALVSSAASSQLLQHALGITPPKFGLDYNPSAATVPCAIDEEGDGQVQTIRATNFNYPAGLLQ